MAIKERKRLCLKCRTELVEDRDVEDYDPFNPPHVWTCPNKNCKEVYKIHDDQLVSV